MSVTNFGSHHQNFTPSPLANRRHKRIQPLQMPMQAPSEADDESVFSDDTASPGDLDSLFMIGISYNSGHQVPQMPDVSQHSAWIGNQIQFFQPEHRERLQGVSCSFPNSRKRPREDKGAERKPSRVRLQ